MSLLFSYCSFSLYLMNLSLLSSLTWLHFSTSDVSLLVLVFFTSMTEESMHVSISDSSIEEDLLINESYFS